MMNILNLPHTRPRNLPSTNPRRLIRPDRTGTLQRRLIRAHAGVMGPPVEREVVRALMLLRLRTLATGRTGARVTVAEGLTGLLNAGITPVVPEHGSLGCSGDLAPLAHCALALMGEGEVLDGDGGGPGRAVSGSDRRGRRPAAEALAAAGLAPPELAEKEGLALINGTDGMLGMLALACVDLAGLLGVADVGAAMSVEGILGTDRAFLPELLALRPHPGQAASADNMLRLL